MYKEKLKPQVMPTRRPNKPATYGPHPLSSLPHTEIVCPTTGYTCQKTWWAPSPQTPPLYQVPEADTPFTTTDRTCQTNRWTVHSCANSSSPLHCHIPAPNSGRHSLIAQRPHSHQKSSLWLRLWLPSLSEVKQGTRTPALNLGWDILLDRRPYWP